MTSQNTSKGKQAARLGLFVNLALVAIKLAGGIAGRSQALIADAVESSIDIASSGVVWLGLTITARPADDDFPYGYGKAETLAAVVVSLMLLAAALGIATTAVREIVNPEAVVPSPLTLALIPIVIVVKELLFRKVARVGSETRSVAVQADAWHHRSDAITSAAAFLGIAIAISGGPAWASADAWAALLAAIVIAVNGLLLLRPTVDILMDRMPHGPEIEKIVDAAKGVGGVEAIEKLRVRKLGTDYFVDLHVQADPMLPLVDAHVLSGKVKGAIRDAVPSVAGVLIHMEPYNGRTF